MNTLTNYFIKDIGLFGSYPLQNYVDELEKIGVDTFINLTMDGEPLVIPYTTTKNYIKYSIEDNDIPEDYLSFSVLIATISNILKNRKKVYIHCRAGQGRTGTVIAAVLAYHYDMSSYEALEHTNNSYIKRLDIKQKRRLMGSPNRFVQKNFINIMFDGVMIGFDHPLYPFNDNNDIEINDIKYTMNEALIWYKENTKINVDKAFEILIRQKIDNSSYLKNILLRTYVKPLICFTSLSENYVISDEKIFVNNIYGKLLKLIRHSYLLDIAL